MPSSYRQKGNKYEVMLDFGKDETTGKRVRKYIRVNTEKEAKKAITEHEHNILNNNFVIPVNTTLSDLLDDWFKNYVTKNCALSTQEAYRGIIDTYLKKYLGHIELQKLLPSHIQSYYSLLMEEKKLSANTVKHHHANLRKALDYALKHQFVARNVADAVELPKVEKYEDTIYSVDEIQKLLTLVEGNEIAIAVYLAAYLGLRRGEIAGLQWKNIDMEKRIIRIRETIVRVKTIVHKEPKNKSSKRDLFISDELYEILNKQLEWQGNNKRLFGGEYNRSDFVFTRADGTLYQPDRISGKFKEFLEANELPIIRFHSLRHFVASALLDSGMNVKEVSAILGHSQTSTTLDIYAHLLKPNSENAVNAMSNILNKKQEVN